jgi:hypothetical protein
MQQVVENEVPFGLDFEMPEVVWVLETAGGLDWVVDKSGTLVHAWATEADCFAALLSARKGKPACLRKIALVVRPASYRFDALRQEDPGTVGAILTDRNWVDIYQRYWA